MNLSSPSVHTSTTFDFLGHAETARRLSIDGLNGMLLDLDSITKVQIEDQYSVINAIKKLLPQAEYHGSECVASKIHTLLTTHESLLFKGKYTKTSLDLLYAINKHLHFCRYVEQAYLLANITIYTSPTELTDTECQSIKVALHALKKLFTQEYAALDTSPYQNHKFGMPNGIKTCELEAMNGIWKSEKFQDTLKKEYSKEFGLTQLDKKVQQLVLADLKAHPSPTHPGHKLKAKLNKERQKEGGIIARFLEAFRKRHPKSSKSSSISESVAPAKSGNLSIKTKASDSIKSPSIRGVASINARGSVPNLSSPTLVARSPAGSIHSSHSSVNSLSSPTANTYSFSVSKGQSFT